MPYSLAFTLVEPGRPATESAWADDAPAASDARARHNDAVAAALCAALPGLAPVEDRTEDAYGLMEDSLPAEVMIRRFHRLRVLEGPCAAGHLRVLLLDGLLDATLTLAMPGDLATLERTLAEQGASLAAASGYAPTLGGEPVPAPALAAHLVAANAAALHRLDRARRRHALLARAGVPSLVLLTLLALLAASAAVQDGLARGRLALGADPTRPMTFITQAVPPPGWRLFVLPQFHLEGVVRETGARVRLEAYRDQVLRAGPGAPFTVLPLPGAEPPYVLAARLEAAWPAIALGPVGIAWPALLAAVPLGLWAGLVLRPWLTTPAPRRVALRISTSRQALSLLLGGAAFALALALRHFL